MGQEVELEGKFVPATALSLAVERRIRLRRTNDVRRVYDEGRSWAHPLLVLIARPNGLDFTRVGVTASRSVGGAVARNRAKRVMREAARRLYPQFGAGWDVMLVARAGIIEGSLPHTRGGGPEPQVEEALASLLRRAGLNKSEACPERWPEPVEGRSRRDGSKDK